MYINLIDKKRLSNEKKAILNPMNPESASAFTVDISPPQRKELDALLQRLEAAYDPAEDMLHQPFTSPGYHTTLTGGTVHPTRESLVYAVALLDSGQEEHVRRAARIFRRVIALQDTDPASKTYGIWSWFLEEPLAQMSPPDWNWADFCGAQLLEALLSRRHLLPADLAAQMDQAVIHAARSIERRDVTVAYTNIAIMGSFVALAAAESYALSDLHGYALGKLRKFYDYTQAQGGFTEYNSPNYTLIALNELLRLQRYARNPEAAAMAAKLYERAWQEIAVHFHPPSGQWAGPHSRSYQTFLAPAAARLLGRTLGPEFDRSGQPSTLSEEAQRMTHTCPAHLRPYFFQLEKTRTLHSTFLTAKDAGGHDLTGTTWLSPELTLASNNCADFWNQRRALLAYWGSPEAPLSLRPRLLHDGYDFSAAQLFCKQEDGSALCAVAFATDGGDRHISLDPLQGGCITAGDLRLRFEFSGEAAYAITEPAPTVAEQPLRCTLAGIEAHICVALAKWGGHQPRWEKVADKTGCNFDLVLYSGEPRTFDLNEIGEALIVFSLSLAPAPQQAQQAQGAQALQTAPVAGQRIRITMDNHRCTARSQGMEISLPTAPAPLHALQKSVQM